MPSKVDASGGLTTGGAKKTTTLISEDHPQRDAYLASIAKPAVSLEAWFDAGLKQAVNAKGRAELTGARPLPHGYIGCSQGKTMIHTSRAKVQVWPVRLDLGEWEVDTQKAWTLYHYTHKESFEKCLHMLSHPEDIDKHHGHAQMTDMHGFAAILFDEFQADFHERCPKPTDLNPKGELELLAIEPGKFAAKEDILLALFGGKIPLGMTHDGRTFDAFADCCLGVRVPGSACFPLVSADGNAGSGVTVRIDRETLDALHLRGEARRALAKKKQQEEALQAGQQEVGKKKKGGCLSCLFGGGGSDEQDLDAIKEKQRRERRKIDGQERIQRDKKTSEVRVMQLTDRWAKEHFANVKADKDRLEAQRKEMAEVAAEREAVVAAKRRAQEEASRLSDPTKHTGQVRTAEQVEKILRPDMNKKTAKRDAQPKPSLAEKFSKAMGNEVMDKDALQLYRDHKARENGEREFAMAPLARMKQSRSVHKSKASHPQETGVLELSRAAPR